MHSIPSSTGTGQPTATTTAGGENRHGAHIRHIIEATLWFIGLLVLATASFYIHGHKGPLPGELEFSRTVQSIHYWPWFIAMLTFFSSLNDIPPSIIAMIVWVGGMLLLRWYKQAAFLALTVGFGNAVNALIGDFVGRPRPTPNLIHVTTKLVFNSFPSGHTEHDVVYYGCLLYLSFTKPVREWRYHWVLLPFQIFAVMAILLVGFSRIYEGEHWLSDVLAGYLSGLLWLFLGIFVYRWATDRLARRKARKMEEKQLKERAASAR